MRLFIPLIVAVALLVAFAWSRVPGNLPSSFFRNIDRDNDFRVSYAEWQAELHAKRDWPQREWDFHSMDCNSDLRLNWLEYRRVVFKGGARCGRNPDIATRPTVAGSPSRSDDTFIIAAPAGGQPLNIPN